MHPPPKQSFFGAFPTDPDIFALELTALIVPFQRSQSHLAEGKLVSRFYASKEVRKGLGGSDGREPLSEVELTRCQAKRICALVNLKNLVSPLILLDNMSF